VTTKNALPLIFGLVIVGSGALLLFRASDKIFASRGAVGIRPGAPQQTGMANTSDSTNIPIVMPKGVDVNSTPNGNYIPPVTASVDELNAFYVTYALRVVGAAMKISNPTDAIVEIRENSVTVTFPLPMLMLKKSTPPSLRAEYHAKVKWDIRTGVVLEFLVGS
jgi:hypothetical protein